MRFRNPLISRGGPPVSLSFRAARWGALATGLALVVIAMPVIGGWMDARDQAEALASQADAIIASGRGPDDLGSGQFAQLLAVQDPAFATHTGVDFKSPGAGLTTMTQSVSKRLAFDEFEPGWAKLRQTGFAIALETRLSKQQIAALWLETAEMGVTDAGWTVGFFAASEALHDRGPSRLDDEDYADLVARLIAPGRLSRPDGAVEREARAARILRLWAGDCAPRDHGDVWLEGCA